MNRFFLIPLLALLLAVTGCTCSVRGSATMPTQKPAASPTTAATPTATAMPTMSAMPSMSAAPETVAPVEPTAMPSASATAGN